MLQAAKIYASVKTCQDIALEPLYETVATHDHSSMYEEAKAARHEAAYERIGVDQSAVRGQEAEELAIFALMSSRRQELEIDSHTRSMSVHKAVSAPLLALRVRVLCPVTAFLWLLRHPTYTAVSAFYCMLRAFRPQ